MSDLLVNGSLDSKGNFTLHMPKVVSMLNAYGFICNCPINSIDPYGFEGKALGKKGPECYTKKDIPKEVEKELPDWAKKRLEKSCFKFLGMTCYPGVLVGGGVYGVCVKCYF